MGSVIIFLITENSLTGMKYTFIILKKLINRNNYFLGLNMKKVLKN